jgi:hypothetical protein
MASPLWITRFRYKSPWIFYILFFIIASIMLAINVFTLFGTVFIVIFIWIKIGYYVFMWKKDSKIYLTKDPNIIFPYIIDNKKHKGTRIKYMVSVIEYEMKNKKNIDMEICTNKYLRNLSDKNKIKLLKFINDKKDK